MRLEIEEIEENEFHDLVSLWEKLYAQTSDLNSSLQKNLNASEDFHG